MKEYNAVVEVPSIESNLVPVFLSKIGDMAAYVCDARALHAFLGVGKRFASWIQERIEEYGFVENQDFVIDFPNLGNQTGRGGDRRSKDYRLSLDMAKELSMVERNDKGREARRYFIECERRALAAAGQVVPASHTDTLIPSEQQTLSEIVHRKTESVPNELRGKALAEIWSRLHRKFRISQYAQLSRTQLSDAIVYVTGMELRVHAAVTPPPVFIPLTHEQSITVKSMTHRIGHCCHFKGSASDAVSERLRFQFGLRGVSELSQEQYSDAHAELTSLLVLAEQHEQRMIALDEEFIEAVLRPAVSIRKIRAMAAKRQLPPLTF